MGRLFGTDGIRGVANEKLTVELAVAVGRAVAASIGVAKGRSGAKKTILLGMDTRQAFFRSGMTSSTSALCRRPPSLISPAVTRHAPAS